MKPFVKWAGGKRQILDRILTFVKYSLEDSGKDISKITYFEPFLGGGAVLFKLSPKKAHINDLNEDLINAYKVIQSQDFEKLIKQLRKFQNKYNHSDKDELYYNMRDMDRNPKLWNKIESVQKAARMIFLNRTCYNGLYRVNSKGEFNTPIGRYKNPTICDENNIIDIHNYLSTNKIIISSGDYTECINKAKAGDIIYIDPPYDYEDDDGFTKYQMSGFNFLDFIKLKKACDKALKRGAYVIISNNATDRVIKLFSDDPNYKIYSYDMNKFATLRSINCKGEFRKTGIEVIFWGVPNLVPFPQANDIDIVINLMMSKRDDFSNKDDVNSLLEEKLSERQIAYYLSALKFFGYINNDSIVTDAGKKVRVSKKCIIEDMKSKLLQDERIEYLIENNNLSVDEMASYLRKKYKKLNTTTAKRRASTIKSWTKRLFNL